MEIVKFVEKNFCCDYIVYGNKEDYIRVLMWIESIEQINTSDKNWDMLYTMTLHQGELSIGAFPVAVMILKKYNELLSVNSMPAGVIAYLIEVEALRHLQEKSIQDFLKSEYESSFANFIKLFNSSSNMNANEESVLALAVGKILKREYQIAVDVLDSIE